MRELPENKTTNAKRIRVLVNTGGWYAKWYMVTDDGTLWVDEQGYGQFPKGTWRYILERETKTITYEEYTPE